ncbi:type II/IV secretion system protein [Scleromatobacter humisilvae]|uniref:Flp pilus assembly complex ATPase component TadA n=1 Tax=Scleromatobacter humisilvae TaxID=2897159 RepID=A0A9X1YKV6_9BURK|nr:ATPase, T2SS/T4P/T4SS family [Scleromatobacter humisilvae]MCK9687821.1 Flp pilus assembly complex ATPase component TadA [Scleromatobacter humisilvae]
MSDLSLPPLNAPELRSADRAPAESSLWAMPPAANAGTAWPLGTSEPCAILGLNDKSFNARLAQFDANTGLATVFVPPARSPMQLRFGQFQRLTLTEPVMPSSNGVNAAPGWADRVPGDTEFQVQLNNGKSHTGRTISHVENDQGLFLFPPIGESGLVQRMFYPRSAYRRVDFGPRLGEVLVSQHTLSPQQLRDALAEQQRIRNLKLGEMLVEVELITPPQLQQALELQSRTPMLRLGEALISLTILSPENLASALRSQTRNRNLPLGELLVNHGVISREELREALEIKRAQLPDDAPSLPMLDPLVFQTTASPPQITEALAEAEKQQPKPQRPGDALRSDHVKTPEQLHAAIEAQSRMPMVRIGEALIALGYITEGQLAAALTNQGKDRKVPLGELLVNEGLITRSNLQTALARKMGYPQVDVLAFPIDIEALRKLPVAAAQRLEMLPLGLMNGKVIVATEDPSRRDRIDEAEFLTQSKVVPVLPAAGNLLEQIPLLYAKGGLDEMTLEFSAVPVPESQSSDSLLAALELPGDNMGKALSDDSDDAVEQSDSSLVRLINSMIVEAHTQGVSDIHIETRPGREKVKVRFRVDGLLRPYLELPHTYRQALVARLKIMCDLDISERRRPQDGKINFARFVPSCPIELRVAMIPTANGLEDAVLRILASAKPLPLDSLGMSPHNLSHLKKAVERPYGMVLCVGPTGSGKTTTLHSALSFINTPERKIWTAEDPVEITQAGLRQVQVNPKIDWTFAKALRAFLRADPDVIMVGEIRDNETAQIAVESSLTGHLVLSTLHTNSAPETITRLLDMGMDPFNFADALLAVLAQRLVRRICSGCKTSTPATDEQIEELLNDSLHIWGDHPQAPTREATLADWTSRYAVDGRLMFYKGTGCAKCGNTGVKGRAGVHELLTVTKGVRHLIQQGGRAEQIQQHAMGEGMRTLRQDGIEKVLAGVTTIEEVRATSNN